MCCSYYVYMKKREANLGIRFYRHRYWLISEVVNSVISGSKMYSMKPILKMKTLSYWKSVCIQYSLYELRLSHFLTVLLRGDCEFTQLFFSLFFKLNQFCTMHLKFYLAQIHSLNIQSKNLVIIVLQGKRKVHSFILNLRVLFTLYAQTR